MKGIFDFTRPSALTPVCIPPAEWFAAHEFVVGQSAVRAQVSALLPTPAARESVEQAVWLTQQAATAQIPAGNRAPGGKGYVSTNRAHLLGTTNKSTTPNKGTTSAKGAGMAKSLRDSGGVPPRGRPV